MNTGIETTNVVASVPQAANPRAPDRVERRAIEPSESATPRADEQPRDTSALLQLVRSSAETFSKLLGTLRDPAAAAALSGYAGGVGQQVDTYA